jgi:hypothetical protein
MPTSLQPWIRKGCCRCCWWKSLAFRPAYRLLQNEAWTKSGLWIAPMHSPIGASSSHKLGHWLACGSQTSCWLPAPSSDLQLVFEQLQPVYAPCLKRPAIDVLIWQVSIEAGESLACQPELIHTRQWSTHQHTTLDATPISRPHRKNSHTEGFTDS